MFNTFDITKMQTNIKITQDKVPGLGYDVVRYWTNHSGERMCLTRRYLDYQDEDLHVLTKDWGRSA